VGLVRMLVRTLVVVDLVLGVHETVWRERVVWLAFCSLLLWESYDGERGKSINPPRRLPPLRDQLTAVSGASQLLVLGNRCLPHLD
jgi:hypothetical protein